MSAQSEERKTIGGQYQYVHGHYGDGVQGLRDELCQMLKKSQAKVA